MRRLISAFGILAIALTLAVGTFGVKSAVAPQKVGACSLVFRGHSGYQKSIYSYVTQSYHIQEFDVSIYWDQCATYEVFSLVEMYDGSALYGGIAYSRVWLSNGNYYGGSNGACNYASSYSACENLFDVYTGYNITMDNYQAGTYSSNYSPNPSTHYLSTHS